MEAAALWARSPPKEHFRGEKGQAALSRNFHGFATTVPPF